MFFRILSFPSFCSFLLVTAVAGCDSDSQVGKDEGFTVPALPKPSLSTLSVQGLELGLKPAFDPGIYHYAAQCGDGDPFSQQKRFWVTQLIQPFLMGDTVKNHERYNPL